MTNNLVQVLLGARDGAIKWDATWNLIAWLLRPHESHNLGPSILAAFTREVLATPLEQALIRSEVNLGAEAGGPTKWPDMVLWLPDERNPRWVIVMDDVGVKVAGSQRKIENLLSYGRIAKARHPDAEVRVAALTNACDDAGLKRVSDILSGRFEGIDWKLVRLQQFGDWISASLSSGVSDPKMRGFLLDVAEWTGANSSSPQRAVG